jgi:chromosome segregation ATPase
MSINVKKYTKEQMAKMVEETQAEVQELKRVNAALTEQVSQMNGEDINNANEIANLKADLDSAKNTAQYLNDQGQQHWRAWQASKREAADLKNKLNDAEAALRRANGECAFKQEALNVMRNRRYNAEQHANYAEAHPWRNLWAWLKRKLKMA